MRSYLALALAVLVLGFAGCASESNPAAEQKGVAAAEAWLALVDAEKYGESWETAAAFFKKAVSREKWEKGIGVFRKPLGKVVSRELKSKKFKTSLPGAPDGQYVLLQFKTSFEKKKSAIETVTPMLDEDGVWRVSGYYIK